MSSNFTDIIFFHPTSRSNRLLTAKAQKNLNNTKPVAFKRMFRKYSPLWYTFWVINITEILRFLASTANKLFIATLFETSNDKSSIINSVFLGKDAKNV